MSICVLGAGAWGTALASMLASTGQGVTLWARDAHVVEEVNAARRNSKYLGDIPLSEGITANSNLEESAQASLLLYVLPAQKFLQFSACLKDHISGDAKLVLCAKGIDKDSGLLLHDIAVDEFGAQNIAALSGPSFAHDVARGLPTAVSLAAETMELAQEIAGQISRPRFRIYTSDDLVGVEAGGALKNVLALAVGIARGLHLGASAEAALIARGFAELKRLAIAFGAKAETLAGLSGLGDLVLTCSTPQSRNFSYGMALASAEDLANRPLAEGVHSAAIASRLALKHGVETPILDMVVRVLEKKIEPAEAVTLLLARPQKGEA